MHIKSLSIQGFKSYRDQVVIDPFSEKVNICVGRNGAGKSNFFAAIRFVLSDAYTSLQRAERQALLHEGSSTAATFSAYVEIVFDNSDGRIPTGKSETVLRRTIGAKKDDYSLDRKSTSKAEIMSLLDAAGFSRSNPFFIVPQGRITALTNQKDSERLELLKEIAGTRVYEDRRAESTKIMEETDQKRDKIDELLEYIEKRLKELEEEKKELKEFQTADRERRCLEYAIYQHDLEEAREALTQIEEDRANDQASANDKQEQAQTRDKTIATLEAEIAAFEGRADLLKLERRQHETDKREAVKARTQIELLIRDLEDSSTRNQQEREELEGTLEELEADITEKEGELAKIGPDFAELVQRENEARRAMEQNEARQRSLFDKQGRASTYRNQAERDAFLRKAIDEDRAYLARRESAREDIKRNLASAQSALQQNEKKQTESKQEIEKTRRNIQALAKEIEELIGKRTALNERRKEAWKEEAKLEQTVRHANEEMKKAERVLYATMDRATQQGLQAVEKLADRLGQGGVHGPLYTLFECDEMFRTAVEVTAGNSLFHVVVENDDIASRILDVMVKEKLGRVTFVPLNRLKEKHTAYPEQALEAVPMINKLRFDERYRAAMQQVFGKTIMVPDLMTGNAYSRSHGLTAITLAGDKQDRKGALTGGYHDARRSRLDAAKQHKAWASKHSTDRAARTETHRALHALDQEITGVQGEVQVREMRANRLRDAREPLAYEVRARETETEQIRERIDALEGGLRELEGEVADVAVRLQSHQEEMETPMTSGVSAAEEEALEKLGKEIQRTRKELSGLTKDRTALASKKSLLEIELNQNLRRKLEKTREKLDSLADAAEGGSGRTQATGSLAARRAELDSLRKSIEAASAKLDAADREADEVSAGVLAKQRELEAAQTKAAEDARGLAKQQKSVERYLAKRQLLLKRKVECNKQIRDLGVLPEEAFERHSQGIRTEKLYKALHKANELLRKFTSVNKKAVDQYNEFTSQRDQLRERRAELDTSAESIEELIEVLDQRKDEAINRTFKQVAKNFEEVFEKLVPQGRGRLIMLKRLDANDDEEEEEEEDVASEAEEEEEEEEENGDDDELDGEEEEEDEDDDEPASKRQKKGKGKALPKKQAKSSSKKVAKGKVALAKKGKGKGKGRAAASKEKKHAKVKSLIDSYTGVSIKVSFNSKSDEGLHIQQLSGGQKSLVALTVIFAIQKCDPAPFYLFDEIDANLDTDRRTAVANMISELSESAQFIITTFRPELLSGADKFFGVIFDNRKISHVREIKQEEAYGFIENAAGAGQGAQQQQQGGAR